MNNFCQIKNLFALAPLVFFPASEAQTFKETMMEFKKFEAITKAGVNYNRYVESLAAIEYATEAYASEANQSNEENKNKFKNSLKKYKLAADAWSVYLASKRHGVPEAFIDPSKKYCPNSNFFSMHEIDNFHTCISEIWGSASDELTDAKEMNIEKAPPSNKRKK